LPVKGHPKLADTTVKCILLGYYTLPGTQSKAYKCYDRVKRKVYKSRDVTFIERGKTSGRTEVITDLRNLPPIIPNPPAAPEVPPTPENPPIPPAADAEFFAGEDAKPEEQDESEAEEEPQVFAPEVAVDEPMAPRVRRLALRFDGMVDERANLPKGRYKPKAAPPAPIVEPEPETEPDELEEKEEFQAHARPARVPEPPIVIPLTFKQAMTSAHSEEWANAMLAEFGSLIETGTFEYIDAPEGRKVITCKWVFSVKYNQWNEFERFKARLVARGFTQIYGIDYKETFAPVVKFTSPGLCSLSQPTTASQFIKWMLLLLSSTPNSTRKSTCLSRQVFLPNSIPMARKWFCGFTSLSTALNKLPVSGTAS
jgi:hypothetical protein